MIDNMDNILNDMEDGLENVSTGDADNEVNMRSSKDGYYYESVSTTRTLLCKASEREPVEDQSAEAPDGNSGGNGLLKVVAGVGVVYLIYRGAKSLIGKYKKAEEEREQAAQQEAEEEQRKAAWKHENI